MEGGVGGCSGRGVPTPGARHVGLTVSEQVPFSAIIKPDNDNDNDSARYEQPGIVRAIEKTRRLARESLFRPSSERGSEREGENLEETTKALSRKS
ncbi:hypothetical protein LTR56_027783, partial [Elasticomyces elasticus]